MVSRPSVTKLWLFVCDLTGIGLVCFRVRAFKEMAGLFPPDSLLGRYEDLLSEKNSLVGRVKTLESELKRVYVVSGASQASSIEQNELDVLLQSFERSDVFCARTACETPTHAHPTDTGETVIYSDASKTKEKFNINSNDTTHTLGKLTSVLDVQCVHRATCTLVGLFECIQVVFTWEFDRDKCEYARED